MLELYIILLQDRARAEVTEIVDRSEGHLGITEIQNLNYLERCIKESLRLYPPVATMSRTISEDLQLRKIEFTRNLE